MPLLHSNTSPSHPRPSSPTHTGIRVAETTSEKGTPSRNPKRSRPPPAPVVFCRPTASSTRTLPPCGEPFSPLAPTVMLLTTSTGSAKPLLTGAWLGPSSCVSIQMQVARKAVKPPITWRGREVRQAGVQRAWLVR